MEPARAGVDEEPEPVDSAGATSAEKTSYRSDCARQRELVVRGRREKMEEGRSQRTLKLLFR